MPYYTDIPKILKYANQLDAQGEHAKSDEVQKIAMKIMAQVTPSQPLEYIKETLKNYGENGLLKQVLLQASPIVRDTLMNIYQAGGGLGAGFMIEDLMGPLSNDLDSQLRKEYSPFGDANVFTGEPAQEYDISAGEYSQKDIQNAARELQKIQSQLTKTTPFLNTF